MGHAYIHAQSSARRFGGQPDHYLPIHDFLDATKQALADPRHRLILHHSLGTFTAEQRFGHVITTPGKVVPVRVIAEQHIFEDFGRVPTPAALFEALRPTPLHTRHLDQDVPERHAALSAAELGGTPEAHLPVHRFLNAAFACLPPHQARAVTHHTYGVHLCTELFGAYIGGVSTAEIARTHLWNDLNCIPTPDDMLTLTPPDWVSRGTIHPDHAPTHASQEIRL